MVHIWRKQRLKIKSKSRFESHILYKTRRKIYTFLNNRTRSSDTNEKHFFKIFPTFILSKNIRFNPFHVIDIFKDTSAAFK